ncbi:MAG: gas vesicle protein GvpG [candidate division Zixibacteria bacterium]|nr:gas vesicle protein GvpG [candidate division Zixibacteria bacterium]
MAFLLDDILLAPVNGVVWLGRKFNEVAQKEYSGQDCIKEQLMELQLRFEVDEIGEEEYGSREKELLERLDAINE